MVLQQSLMASVSAPVFTSDWVTRHIPNWKKHLGHLAGRPHIRFLEIGSWEGRSTCWFLSNILTHASARIICIDTFKGSPDELAIHQHLRDAIGGIERRFERNIKATGAAAKVRKIKGFSQNIVRAMPHRQTFDVIYIDGSHEASDVLTDAVLCWPLLKPDGILIFDDYRWVCLKGPRNRLKQPKPAVDAFIDLFSEQLRVLSKGRQVFVRKNSR